MIPSAERSARRVSSSHALGSVPHPAVGHLPTARSHASPRPTPRSRVPPPRARRRRIRFFLFVGDRRRPRREPRLRDALDRRVLPLAEPPRRHPLVRVRGRPLRRLPLRRRSATHHGRPGPRPPPDHLPRRHHRRVHRRRGGVPGDLRVFRPRRPALPDHIPGCGIRARRRVGPGRLRALLRLLRGPTVPGRRRALVRRARFRRRRSTRGRTDANQLRTRVRRRVPTGRTRTTPRKEHGGPRGGALERVPRGMRGRGVDRRRRRRDVFAIANTRRARRRRRRRRTREDERGRFHVGDERRVGVRGGRRGRTNQPVLVPIGFGRGFGGWKGLGERDELFPRVARDGAQTHGSD